jgi:hypothetical protein
MIYISIINMEKNDLVPGKMYIQLALKQAREIQDQEQIKWATTVLN